MKFFKPGLSMALVVAGFALVPSTSSATAGAARADDPPVTSRMRAAADGTVRISTETATGRVGFVAARGADADLYPDLAGDSTGKAATKARTYLDRFGTAFGAGKGELVQTKVDSGAWGWTVTYVQQYRGVPVFGSTIKANLDKDGDLTAVTGYAAPGLDLSVAPRVSAADAGARAVSIVKADPPTTEEGEPAATAGIEADPKLVIYRTGSTRGATGESLLAYQVQVTNGTNVRDMVVLDAATNKPLNRYSMMTDAIDRELYETSPAAASLVWSEGDPFPGTLNTDQQNLVISAGESYWLYANTFGRDSYDGLGATMKTVNNDPRINCPNANWNGTTTNYCDGVTSDDVVSHEWGHAYTEYTSGLIYQYQSGALNESYSDVWGETLDLINGREDEDEVFDTVRAVGDCDPTAGARLQVNITAPAGQTGSCTAAFGFGPAYTTDLVTTDVTVATDPTDAPNGTSPTDGCGAFTNAAAIAGHYAYVDRGTCSFQIKADNAVAAGATGLIVGQSVAGLPTTMSGTSTIPATMVSQADGTRIKTAGTVVMTIEAEDISGRPDTTRWLVGEKSTAFGGAIRDMWNPTCYGNPGKVTDAEYNCDPNNLDSGGVHGNSGVPNHAYALVVDGGTYNGQTIAGIGLDKAANVWWRAQTAYLTPVSDFTAAADGLEQSCVDLIGQPINQLSTAVNGTPTPATPITAADCTQVANTMTAVEMRAEPVQCNFQPLLDKDTPSLCGEGFTELDVFSEDFEDGLAGWTTDQVLYDDGDYAGGFGAPWEASTSAPGDHPGGVAYGPVPDLGDCSGDGVNDFSSSDAIISPDIALPAGIVAPVLSFDQYIATEAGFDGGNVQVSVDGGPFAAVPAGAYTFNAPKTLTTAAGGSSNPLAGQPGFTGTDGGEVGGSWGTSQVDLSAAGVSPGTTVKLRIEVGRDGCGGIDGEFGGGWYVDNVTISTCREDTNVTAVHQPEPSTYGQPSKVEVTVDDATATGSVEITAGDQTLGSGDVTDGAASISLSKTLGAGTYAATVSYSGDDTNAASDTPVTITVAKAVSTTKVLFAPGKVTRGSKARVKVRVTAPGVTPGGTVRLFRGDVVYGTGRLVDGVVTITTRRLTKVGKVKLAARYAPGPNLTPSNDAFAIEVVQTK